MHVPQPASCTLYYVTGADIRGMPHLASLRSNDHRELHVMASENLTRRYLDLFPHWVGNIACPPNISVGRLVWLGNPSS